MSNNDTELYELCKQVYERTGWEDVRDFYHENDTFDEETQTFKRNGIFSIVERKRADYNTPLYTSDYLLEKLPKRIGERYLELWADGEVWVVYYYENPYGTCWPKIGPHADTPLKALLKLTLKLHEQGLLPSTNKKGFEL